jgi:hypothetical protein
MNLFVGLAICVLFVLILLWATRAAHQTVPVTYNPTNIDPDIAYDPEIQDEIAAGRKIQAIKLYRDVTGCGLKEAKDAIEFLIAHPDYDLREKGKNDADGLPLDAGVREMLRAGRRQDAVQIYQDFTGADAEDAEAEITRLEWEENHNRSASQR